MKLSRDLALKVHFILDQLIPPIIRDSKWFMYILFRLLYKEKMRTFFTFKKDAMSMNIKTFSQTYQEIEPVLMERETDLNKECIDEIIKNIVGTTVLEVGCGHCFLFKKLQRRYIAVGTDLIIDPSIKAMDSSLLLVQTPLEALPFQDKMWDTVICAHTLEHVQNISLAIHELRRVTKKRLIIVVPKQRSYKYTFDLHLHFFPYIHSFLALMGPPKNNFCKEIQGDIFYIEDIQ